MCGEKFVFKRQHKSTKKHWDLHTFLRTEKFSFSILLVSGLLTRRYSKYYRWESPRLGVPISNVILDSLVLLSGMVLK